MTVSQRSFIKVYCTVEEKQLFTTQAQAHQLSNSSYGRRALFSLSMAPQIQEPDKLYLRLGELYLLLSVLASSIAQRSHREVIGPGDMASAQAQPQGALPVAQVLSHLEQLQGEIAQLGCSIYPPGV